MYQVDNKTDWPAGLYPGWSRDSKPQMTFVFKIGYSFDDHGKITPLADIAPVVEEDLYTAEPGKSSLVAGTETVPFKQGGEVLLTGTVKPAGNGVRAQDINLGLRLADDSFWEKQLRLFGRRSWHNSLLGAVPSKPAPLEEIPLIYELAYGGADPNNAEKIYAKNPVGLGYSDKGWRLKQVALPQIEQGPKFITKPTSRVNPAGFGPLPLTWPPRLDLQEELDLAQLPPGGSPYPAHCPADLHNCAPPDQRFNQPFAGTETIRLKGFLPASSREGVLINLPGPRPQVTLQKSDQTSQETATCDTMQIDIDQQQVLLTYRLALPEDPLDQTTSWILLNDLDAEEEAS
ncbi:MAG: DUF2169 domain-containing protein [Thermodesulfobacteriota bacterium]